jgi:hypothetical protein
LRRRALKRRQTQAAALAEKAALAKVLEETLKLELSDAKTAITPVVYENCDRQKS